MGYGTVVLDPDHAAPAGAVADVHLVAAVRRAGCPRPAGRGVRGRHDRVREPAGGGPGAPRRRRRRRPAAGRRRDRPGPGGREVVPARTRRADGAVVDAATPVGYPAIVKTARLGYDGKGQVAVADDAELDRGARPTSACRASSSGGCRSTSSSACSSPAPPTVATVTYPGRRERTTSTASSTSPSCRPGSPRRSPPRPRRWRRAHRRGPRLRRRAGRRAVRQRRPAARQRAGAAPPQQRPLDARRVGDEPVRAAGAGRVRAGPRPDRCRRRRRPWRWSTCSATAGPAATPAWERALADPAAHLHLYGKREARPGPQDGPPHGASATTRAARVVALRDALTR